MQKEEIRRRLLLDIEKLKSRRGYLNAGYPGYNTLFGRDSLIAARQMLPIDPSIARATLKTLAKFQARRENKEQDAKPGAILHEFRFSRQERQKIPDWKWPYFGSVDATSLFLITLEDYVRVTGDEELLKGIWPNATSAMQWHLDNAKNNPYGFITYERQNPNGLYHQGWKDAMEDHLKISPLPVAIVEEQGYAYRACKAYISLAERYSLPPTLTQEATSLAQKIKKNFVSQFWCEEKQYFALGLNGEGQQRQAITSNPGHLLLAYDLLEEPYARAIVRRLFQKDLWTIGGIRTLSTEDPDFNPFGYHLGSVWPHDNGVIYEGLILWGFWKEAEEIKRALLRAWNTLGCIPECYAVVRGFLGAQKIVPIQKISQLEDNTKKLGRHLTGFRANPLQAWAIGALLNMLSEY